MKCMVDVPNELIIRAAEEINKKRGICNILPASRFSMASWDNEFKYGGLVCDNRMGDKQTGIAAAHCNNCALEKKEAAQRATNTRIKRGPKRAHAKREERHHQGSKETALSSMVIRRYL